MIISSYAPELLGQDKDDLFNNFFLPSFIVRNLATGYEYCQLIIPHHPVWPDIPDIIHIDSDSESDTIVTEKMLPSISFGLDEYKGKNKRGRPRNTRIHSRGANSGDVEGIRNKIKIWMV